jgi:hypothetical protein
LSKTYVFSVFNSSFGVADAGSGLIDKELPQCKLPELRKRRFLPKRCKHLGEFIASLAIFLIESEVYHEHAQGYVDANVIKWVYGFVGNLPELATEYTLSFQLDAGLIGNEYRQVIEQASDAGDSFCQEAVEQHVNPRTAIIGRVTPAAARTVQKGGEPMNVFYQVPSSFSQSLTAKVALALTGETAPASSLEPLRDYCMVDGAGRKVAIIDPASGAVVPACEKFSQEAMAKTVLMTKSGACRDDRGHWAYYPSRIRTARFGRGIQWILTEWFLHNQVGDYKNIHWYQNAWKSGV